MDLIVTMDDATNTIYAGFLVPEEATASTFQALLEVFGEHGLPLSLYTDRGSHYFHTAEAGGPVDRKSSTQVGRAPRVVSSTRPKGKPGAAGGGAHCGLFPPGARAVGASVWNPAGSAGEGAGVGGDRHGCSRQRVYP